MKTLQTLSKKQTNTKDLTKLRNRFGEYGEGLQGEALPSIWEGRAEFCSAKGDLLGSGDPRNCVESEELKDRQKGESLKWAQGGRS